MPSLRETQRGLRTVFIHPRGVAAGLAAAGFTARKPVTAWVADQPPVPLPTRLAVYSDGYFLRLLDTLGQDFAAVRRAAGAEGFQRIVAAYLLRHPSRSPLINDAGAALPAFLRGHPASRKMPFLPELAALESAAVRALFTDRLPPPGPGAFAALGPGSRLRLDPTVRLLRTGWAVDRLWAGRGSPDGEGPRRLTAPSPRHILLHRDDAWVRVAAVTAAEFAVLEALAAGRTLAEALRRAGKAPPPSTVRAWFARWMESGVLKGVRGK